MGIDPAVEGPSVTASGCGAVSEASDATPGVVPCATSCTVGSSGAAGAGKASGGGKDAAVDGSSFCCNAATSAAGPDSESVADEGLSGVAGSRACSDGRTSDASSGASDALGR